MTGQTCRYSILPSSELQSQLQYRLHKSPHGNCRQGERDGVPDHVCLRAVAGFNQKERDRATMKSGSLFCIRSVAAGILLIGGMLHAQVANNTALVGNVEDPSGAPVSGAKVTAVNEATGI